MRLPKKFAQKSRKVFYFIHLWTGLLLGLWFVLMGLTGSALAWRSELYEWEIRSRISALTSGPSDKIIPASQAIAALKAFEPALTPELGMTLPNSRRPYYIYYARGPVNGVPAQRVIFVNGLTGHVYPPVYENQLWMHTVDQIHQNLLLEGFGSVSNGVLSFFAVFMLASGLWLWWPSTVKQLKQRLIWKRGVSLRRTLYDLHNMLGVYTYGLLFLLAFTGAVLIYNDVTEQGVRRGVNGLVGVKDVEGRGRRRGGLSSSGNNAARTIPTEGQPLSIDEMIAKAKATFPNHTLLYLRMPRRLGQPAQASFDFVSLNYGIVSLNAYTGKPLASDGTPPTPGENTMNVVSQMHYGWFGNNWSKTLYCLSGFMPLGLFITGVWMWLKKKRSQQQAKLKRRTIPGKTEVAVEV